MVDFKERIRQGGLKVTSARVALVEAMQKGHHMSVKEIASKMDDPNIASIYNNLFEFKQIGLVFTINQGRKKLYELNTYRDGHHNEKYSAHLTDKRGIVHDINCDDVISLLEKKFSTKYKIKSIKIEISE